MGPFRDSLAPSWLSGPLDRCTGWTPPPPLIVLLHITCIYNKVVNLLIKIVLPGTELNMLNEGSISMEINVVGLVLKVIEFCSAENLTGVFIYEIPGIICFQL